MAYTGLIVGSAVSLIGGLFGASKSASAARQQAELQNQAAARRLTYDNQMWEMKKEQLLSDRAHMVESVEIQARNEQKVAMFRDATNQQKYEYDLMIRNREQDSLEKQFDRSEQVFNNQISLNAQSEQIAIQNEYRSLEETHAEAAFNRTEQIIKNIQNEGKIRARGASGRSIDKAAQAEEYNHGAQMAMLNESLASAGRNTASILQEITLDKNSADLAALAQKMLDPGDLPLPLKPFKTPIADFQYPREFTEADFGPKPVLGATASPSAAAGRVWGSAISGIAGSVGGMVGSFDFSQVGSDIRLKENVKQLDTSPSGLNIYEWNYIGDNTKYTGVVAQDLIAKGRQDAVKVRDGYYVVDYSKIDVPFLIA